jgi:hypothetical protein
MAIAFRSVGTRLKADVSVTGGNLSLALPAGHAAGDLLLMFVLTDSNSSTTVDPAGWTRLMYITTPTASRAAPYYAAPRLKVFYRIDTGSLGSTVGLTFSTSSWPVGNPYVLAFTASYTGADQAGPIENWGWNTTAATSVAQAHPQITTATANDWLLTFRATSSAGFPDATFTIAGGTNTERVDDQDGFDEMAAALYDSGAALATGAQTVRTTTANREATYGSLMVSIAVKPSAVAGSAIASPTAANVTATAYSPTVLTQDGPWDLCGGGMPQYSVAIDWAGDGAFTGSDDVTGSLISDVSISYGRDQERQISPGAVGSAAFTLNNADRRYSPENTSSPLTGTQDPARPMRAQVVWGGRTYPLFGGRIDDYSVKTEFGDRSVDLSFLDGLNDLSGVPLSTGVYASMRTGELVHVVLDEAGWTGGRDIDAGATIVRYWWADGTDALAAVGDLVKSEGPPAVAYVAPDGTFVFRDRHHRLRRQASLIPQAVFHAGALGDCTQAGVPEGALSLAKPFTYAHNWANIINSVTFEVTDRAPSGALGQVWQDESSYVLELGQSLDLTVSTTDPFFDAVTPVAGTDILYTGPGVVSALLSRTSGVSARLTLQAIGGRAVITFCQMRARSLEVRQTTRVTASDPGSISQHGERAYPDAAPWAGARDAEAIANQVLLYYARRRPTVQVRLVSSDPAHFAQVLGRTISDRVRIVNDEMLLDDDFFVERVTHTVQRTGTTGRPPVHSVVLGCEKDLDFVANPFTFDKRGAGFDEGVFDPLQADDASEVFIFDDPVQGCFDTGEFGT